MAPDTYHQPVLEQEIVELFSSLEAGVVLDATLGGAGHAHAILEHAPQLRVLGLDRDPDARDAARTRLSDFTDRSMIVDATFSDLRRVVDENGEFLHGERIVGILMDLGVSSHQLDDPTRGFSFRADAPLDMRMDPTRGETAAQYLARVDPHEFARVLRANGENRFAGAIAKSVLERQPQTTFELTERWNERCPWPLGGEGTWPRVSFRRCASRSTKRKTNSSPGSKRPWTYSRQRVSWR